MRISVNLATRPFSDLGPAIKRLRIAMAVLAVIAIGLGLGLHAFHRQAEEARDHDHSLDSQIARLTQERLGYQNLMHQPENAKLLLRIGSLNQIFDEKAFSWTLAMEDLETVLPAGVQVSTLEPVRSKDGRTTLRLRVIGPRDKAVELVRNLERSKRFLLPRIVGENSESSGGPGEKLEPVSASNRVNFDLLADYNPASPSEHRRSVQKLAGKSQQADTSAAERQNRQPEAKTQATTHEKPSPAVRQVAPAPSETSPIGTSPQIQRPHPNGSAQPMRFRHAPNPNAGGPQ